MLNPEIEKKPIQLKIEQLKSTMSKIGGDHAAIANQDTIYKMFELEIPDIETVDVVLKKLISTICASSTKEAAGLSDDQGLSERDMVVIVVEYVLNNASRYDWPLARYQSGYYVYTGTHWQEFYDDRLKAFLGEAAERIKIPPLTAKYFSFREKLFKQFYSAAFFMPPETKKDEVKINLQNGTYVISKEKRFLKQHDQNDFQLYKLPFAYDPEAKCPMFQQFLDRVLPDKCKQTVLAEFMGYVFVKNSILKLEKGLILYGTGKNGKSVFFEIINALIGWKSISNFSLQSLTDNSGYTRSLLVGKLLNYATEISERMNTTVFKALISGEPVEARMIYKEPFLLTDYCRFIFNTNGLPKDVEQNLGFFRRFIIIHFDQTITEEEKDASLANKIIADELPGVFNWVLQGLERVLAQEDFTTCPTIDDALDDYRRNSDSVALYIDDGNFEPSMDDTIPLKDMFSRYREFCKDSNYNSCSIKSFSDRLKNIGFTTTRKSSGRYVGIRKKKF